MVNEEIAEIFDHMARVLAFKGKDRFRALAYERAGSSLRGLEQDLAEMARAGKLEEIPGIGHDLSEMIEEYLKTGRIRRCEQEINSVPDGLIELMDIPGLGPKTLARLHQKFCICSTSRKRSSVGAVMKPLEISMMSKPSARHSAM